MSRENARWQNPAQKGWVQICSDIEDLLWLRRCIVNPGKPTPFGNLGHDSWKSSVAGCKSPLHSRVFMPSKLTLNLSHFAHFWILIHTPLQVQFARTMLNACYLVKTNVYPIDYVCKVCCNVCMSETNGRNPLPPPQKKRQKKKKKRTKPCFFLVSAAVCGCLTPQQVP